MAKKVKSNINPNKKLNNSKKSKTINNKKDTKTNPKDNVNQQLKKILLDKLIDKIK